MGLTTYDGRPVCAEVEIADNYWKRVIGLMFRKSLAGALVFDMGRETYDGIHMLFVRFPIDVLFLGPDKTIVDIKANVRPWLGTAFPRSRFRYAIELPAGTVEGSGIRVGDRLSW
jgi:uncharacterized membrane protein (UPF0127 family)